MSTWNGSIWSSQDLPPGNPWAQFPSRFAKGHSTSSGMAALSRLGSIDVIWIGRDGSVNGESLAGMVDQYNIAGPGSAWGSSIAAVSRGQNKLDVWWIGPLGQSEREKLPHEQSGYVYWNSWDWGDTHPSDRYDMPWRGKYQLPQSKAAIRGGLAAVARDSNNMDVWWIGVDGSVNGKTWISGNWQPTYNLAKSYTASTSGGLAAVARESNNVEVLWIGERGTVEGTHLTYLSQNQEPLKTPYWLTREGNALTGYPSDGKI